MSSPVLNPSDFALVAETFREVDLAQSSAHSEGSSLLTARAVMAVTLLGAGSWFMLWKIALHFWMMR